MATIDVAIPNRNYGQYLRTCVKSVLGQEGVDVRVLVIDNASTDDSAAVARTLAAEDSRVELLLREENLGPHASFNAGIDWAESKYFLILCSDDLLAPLALKRVVEIMEANPGVHLTHGRTLFLNEDAVLPELSGGSNSVWRIQSSSDFIRDLCRSGRNPVSGPTAVVRTRVQKRVGPYRSHLTHTDDLEMWLRFGCIGGIARTNAVQAIARVHPQSQSATVANIQKWNAEFEAAFESFFAREGAALPDAVRLRAAARRSLGERAYWSSIAHHLRGEAGGDELMDFAIRILPASQHRPPLGYLLRRAVHSLRAGFSNLNPAR